MAKEHCITDLVFSDDFVSKKQAQKKYDIYASAVVGENEEQDLCLWGPLEEKDTQKQFYIVELSVKRTFTSEALETITRDT